MRVMDATAPLHLRASNAIPIKKLKTNFFLSIDNKYKNQNSKSLIDLVEHTLGNTRIQAMNRWH